MRRRGGGIGYALQVSPSRASTTPGGTVEIQSTTIEFGGDVTWRVREGDAGGTITPSETFGGRVVYTAPANQGTYHVDARAVPREGKVLRETATIVVAP